MEKIHKKVSYSSLIFLLAFSIAFFAIASIVYYASSYNEKNKVYTTAKISRIEEVTDTNSINDNTIGEPSHITYVEYNVGKKTQEAKINYYDSSYEVGQEINIYYYKDDNTKAGTREGDNLSRIFFVISIGFLFSVIVMLVAKRNREKLEKRRKALIQKENLVIVYAKYVETVINEKVTVFGSHPYNIVCEWKDPNNKRYRFTSEDLWKDPQRKILEKNISTFEVKIDKTNMKNYQVKVPESLK